MQIEKVYFNTEDGLSLFGLLHMPSNGSTHNVVISTHGMGSNCTKSRDDIIAKKLTDNGFAYFTFNNRGQGLINTVISKNGKILQGTVFEDVEDSYYDVVGAIKAMQLKGLTNINLQGHSLGSTKTVYTYNKLLENNQTDILNSIKSIILLSLVDLVDVMNFLIKSNKEVDIVKLALEKEKEGNLQYVIDTKTDFMPMVSVKTFFRYYRDNENIDFAKYRIPDFKYEKLNNIKVPIFMRWGNVNELISLPAEELTGLMNKKIQNSNKNISFVNGATHNYSGKADILAHEILEFLSSIN